MYKKTLLSLSAALVLACAIPLAQAQSTPATAPAAAATVAAPSAAKKELLARVVKLQRPGIEAMARDMAQEPALQMLERASAVLQARVAPEKQEGAAKGIQADAKAYADQTVPMVRERAIALAPDVIGPLLNQAFTEEELKKVIAIMESPEFARFQQLSGEMQQALQTKLVADTRAPVEEKLKTLESAITARLNAVTAQPAAAAPAAKPAVAAKATKPAASK